MEPTKIPCLAKGISAGLWVDLESAWAFASAVPPAVTCKRAWVASGGHRRDFMVGCPLAAAVVSCSVQQDRWIVPQPAVRICFVVLGGHVRSLSLYGVHPFGLRLGCLLWIRVGGRSR